MRTTAARTHRLQTLLVLVLGLGILAGCPRSPADSFPDELSVTSSSRVFTTMATNLIEPCNNPAEFGRCGCLLDGIRTSCDLVSRCLRLGFCEVARSQPEGTNATSSSELFSAAAKDYASVCPNPAEFGRCGCFLDGLETSCSFVQRCLELGFCVAVAN